MREPGGDSRVLEGLGVICGLFGIGILMAGCAWLAWWMLEPINRVAGELQGTTRFMLTDAIGLMILLQIGLAITGRALSGVGDEGAATMYWLLLFLMAILILVLWAASVSVVSRAGITRPLQRIAVMVLCVPGTLVVMVALPALAGFSAAGALFFAINHENDTWNAGTVLLMAGGCLLLSGVAILLRRIAFWSLVGSPGGELLARK
jgi:hypothetical protein